MGFDQGLHKITVNCMFNEVTESKIRILLKEMYCTKILATNFNITGKLTYKLITKLLPETHVRAACWIRQ